jgi:hypothetical protein
MSSTIDWISARIGVPGIRRPQRNGGGRWRQGGKLAGGEMSQHLVGTWKLVSATREDTAGSKVNQLGTNPTGYLNYAPDGRMMAIIARGGRTKPAGARATPQEAAALFDTVLSYAGTYSVSGNEVTHHVDVSWNESWTGTQQKRVFSLEGDRLVLATPPSPDPMDGKMSVRRMVWERLKT